MTKQQEIREGLEELMRSAVGSSWAGLETDNILNYLHSKSVVIKVDRGLPPKVSGEIAGIAVSHIHLFEDYGLCLIAVESLIEKD